MTLKAACKNALTILKQVMEEKLSSTNVEVTIYYSITNLFYKLLIKRANNLSVFKNAVLIFNI